MLAMLNSLLNFISPICCTTQKDTVATVQEMAFGPVDKRTSQFY